MTESTRGLWKERFLLGLLLAAVFPVVFFGSATFALGRLVPTPRWLVTPLDAWVGVTPWAVWSYLSWYLLPNFVFVRDRETLRVGVLGMLVSLGACLVGFFCLPVTMARPELVGHAGVSVGLLRRLYSLDPPVNLFPSLHVAVAVTIGRVVSFKRPTAVWVLRLWIAGICASCVLTRQHYVLDVIAGSIVGFFAVDIARGVLGIEGARSPSVVGQRVVGQQPAAEREA